MYDICVLRDLYIYIYIDLKCIEHAVYKCTISNYEHTCIPYTIQYTIIYTEPNTYTGTILIYTISYRCITLLTIYNIHALYIT